MWPMSRCLKGRLLRYCPSPTLLRSAMGKVRSITHRTPGPISTVSCGLSEYTRLTLPRGGSILVLR